MSNGFAVSADELSLHGANVERVATGVDTAVDAARTVRTGGDAYGVLCQFFPAALGQVTDRWTVAGAAMADGLRDSARRLEVAARSYADTDEQAAQSLSRLGRRR
ncbi:MULTISPECIES: type VII secretion target [Catenuloplanes]|uniref:ESX-1 secretion-associated protein n=1 Tax=Catenuloplanes niger TaxID=587534 RepID=A0AAE3ZNM9_9ACTN|nr:type VII secretion target [Catenuloplanes niger]MDR7321950.1 hypothetical protein [Catenuloplanes niger]